MTSVHLAIREAIVADAQAIAEIHVASWQSAYAQIIPAQFLAKLSVEKRAQSWRDALESGSIRVALATAGREVAGWVAYGECRDPDKDGLWGEIYAIYLHPSRYSQVIGASLMERARSSLEETGYRYMSLWVLTENCRARAFYERAGFSTDNETKEVVSGGIVFGRYATAGQWIVVSRRPPPSVRFDVAQSSQGGIPPGLSFGSVAKIADRPSHMHGLRD